MVKGEYQGSVNHVEFMQSPLRTRITEFCKRLRLSAVAVVFYVSLWSLLWLQWLATPLHNKDLATTACGSWLCKYSCKYSWSPGSILPGKYRDSGLRNQKLFSMSRKHGGTFNLCFIHSKQGAYPSFCILNAKEVFILWGLVNGFPMQCAF